MAKSGKLCNGDFGAIFSGIFLKNMTDFPSFAIFSKKSLNKNRKFYFLWQILRDNTLRIPKHFDFLKIDLFWPIF